MSDGWDTNLEGQFIDVVTELLREHVTVEDIQRRVEEIADFEESE